MLAQKLDRQKLLGLAGFAQNAVGALNRPQAAAKWQIVAIAKTAPPPDSGRFFRSVKDHVDDASKKSSYFQMIVSICDAIEEDDYQAAIKAAGSVAVKPAHTFEHANKKHIVWELKCGKKDRIYFYPMSDKRLIFLLMAFHKKDEQTPVEASRPCEADVKILLDPKCQINFC